MLTNEFKETQIKILLQTSWVCRLTNIAVEDNPDSTGLLN